MTLIQGAIAAQLGSRGSSAMWFTSAYLIPMSSLAPVAGRLATIFPPRSLIIPIAALIATGGMICTVSTSFGAFVAGRVIAGTGAAGVLSLAIIIGLELASEKSRGLVLGLINAGFTAGVSFGAIVFGGLMPVIGWVSLKIRNSREQRGG
jgi:MFS family permease